MGASGQDRVSPEPRQTLLWGEGSEENAQLLHSCRRRGVHGGGGIIPLLPS